jgi:prepilin-type N-terminal cleavage/methylation domain-containing protein
VTLIELLIAVAVLSIFAAGLVQTSSTLARAVEMQRTWDEALAIAENEIASVRAHGAPAELGVHDVAPRLRERYPDLSEAVLDVWPGPTANLREVRFRARFAHPEGADRSVTLAAIVHVAASAEAPRAN